VSHPPERVRLDVLLVERNLVSSRSKAQALIRAGQVFSDDQRLDRPGHLCSPDLPLTLRGELRYVSRGGVKLEGALRAFQLATTDLTCADIGASTGGFTDCLLQHGARRVFAVDVGEGQLAPKLRADARVVVLDRTNARHLTRESFSEAIDLAVVDASFIGVEKLLPALERILPPSARLLALIKPQFQAGPSIATETRGVIRDPALRAQLIATATSAFQDHHFDVLGGADSVLDGPRGNREHFVLAKRR
jgi:23S rRNA (cytidine1920-2'-O)/16S rRNA (cytidine1409-2'-O)-methyltransferase